MSKADILAELPRLTPPERTEILDELWRIEEAEAVRRGPSAEEKRVLDAEVADYEKAKHPGEPWPVVEARLRNQS